MSDHAELISEARLMAESSALGGWERSLFGQLADALQASVQAPKVVRVRRGGDFQEVEFDNGSVVYGASEQDEHGNWIDNRGIDALAQQVREGN